MLLSCIIPSSLGKTSAVLKEVARRISGAVAGEAYAKSSQDLTPDNEPFLAPLPGSLRKSQHTKYPSQTLISRITLFAICLSFFSPPLHPCRFINPLFSVRLFLARFLFARLLVVMASSVFIPSSPDFEVLHFKQRQGENLKDAWFRMLESYRNCNIEGDFKILLHNFYVGIILPHRQLLDFSA